MIRPLRQAHRAAIPLLGATVLGGMVLALTTAPDTPLETTVLSSSSNPFHSGTGGDGAWRLLTTVEGVEVQFRGGSADGWVEVRTEEWVPRPDLLVYSSPLAPTLGSADGLPEGSHLLGSFSGLGSAAFQVKGETSGPSASWLVLYSGGHREVLAAVSGGALSPEGAAQ